jgi:putative PIG3 family NAD(P)H quinone oxidoreductase
MKSISIKNETGPAENLYVDTTVPVPELKVDEALVHIKAFGLNRMDLMQREGHYPLPPGCSPILGVEFSGVIEKLHSQHGSNFAVGDEVFGLVSGGAYAEYVAAPTKTLIHLPKGLSHIEAAGIPEVWFTATQVLKFVGGIKEGDSVLFHAGASSVGLAAIQIAQLLGARKVYATISSPEKKTLVESLGAVGINYNNEDFVQEIKRMEPDGVDLIIDPVGPAYLQRDLDALARDGTIVEMGLLSGNVADKVDVRTIMVKRAKIVGTTLRSRTLDYQGELRDYIEQKLLPLIVGEDFKLFVEKVFPMEQIIDAHNLLASNKTMGKLIATID